MKCDYLGCERDATEGQQFCSEACRLSANPPTFSRFEPLDEYDARTKADTLTPLDHFAMAALPAIVSADPEELPGKSWEPRYERIAAEAYAVARAMMAERAK